jgi:hypothetical protein
MCVVVAGAVVVVVVFGKVGRQGVLGTLLMMRMD